MNIHHATKAAIEKAGFLVDPMDDEQDVAAVIGCKSPDFEYDVYDPKTAIADAKALRMVVAEYPNVEWQKDETTWSLGVEGSTFEDTAEEGELQNLVDAFLDWAQAEGIDLGEPEEEDRVVVVPQKYKDEYKARGNPQHCGDWFAAQLDGRFRTTIINPETGKETETTDVEAFAAFCELNGVALTGKWAALKDNPHPSARGRFRMNGGQKVRIRVAATGKLHIDEDTVLTCPVAELEKLWERHPHAFTEYEEAQQPRKTDHKGKLPEPA